MTDHAISSEYWAGARRNELVLQRCDSCGCVRHYPRLLCAECYSFEWSPVTVEPVGAVHSWMVAHHVFDSSVSTDVPYTLVTVDMTAGVRVLGRLDADATPVAGQRVRLEFHADGDNPPAPVFTPAPD